MALSGRYIRSSTAGESVNAFVPAPLPFAPPIELTAQEWDLCAKASLASGRLDAITTLLPDSYLFVFFYLRKEALLSSQIEGTQSSLSDLLLFEMGSETVAPEEDVREVSNYIAALGHGFERVRRDGFPITSRLIKEMHEILLKSGRGPEKNPGEFRRSQNWIGGTRPGNALYVPPPPELVAECMGNLDDFINNRYGEISPLVKAAIAHAQFESIHPFLDGNGRIGRLLMTLMLCAEGILHEPILYLSLYLKSNRSEYYERLQRVRTDGDWIGWIRFFLRGVEDTASQASQTAKEVLRLFEEDRTKIDGLSRRIRSAHKLHDYLRRNAVISTVPVAASALRVTRPTIRRAIESLKGLGIVAELGNRKRNRSYSYGRYLAILSRGTDPIA